MSDRVAVIDSGEILQLGTPGELYERPANLKTAQFIGSPAINTLPARVSQAGRVELAGGELPIRVDLPAGTPLTLGLRPEAIAPGTARLRPSRHCTHACRLENLGAEHATCTSISRRRRRHRRRAASWPMRCATSEPRKSRCASIRRRAIYLAPMAPGVEPVDVAGTSGRRTAR